MQTASQNEYTLCQERNMHNYIQNVCIYNPNIIWSIKGIAITFTAPSSQRGLQRINITHSMTVLMQHETEWKLKVVKIKPGKCVSVNGNEPGCAGPPWPRVDNLFDIIQRAVARTFLTAIKSAFPADTMLSSPWTMDCCSFELKRFPRRLKRCSRAKPLKGHSNRKGERKVRLAAFVFLMLKTNNCK